MDSNVLSTYLPKGSQIITGVHYLQPFLTWEAQSTFTLWVYMSLIQEEWNDTTIFLPLYELIHSYTYKENTVVSVYISYWCFSKLPQT